MVKLGEIFIRLTRKNIENNTNVLTISAKYGLVNQEEFFSKSIASDNKLNYFLLYKGDFAYNKSYSNGYPFGTIKALTRYEKGIVSPLYICFSPAPENHCPEYYLKYIESGLMNKEIKAIAQEGARNHGLLNIGIDDFFNMLIPLPSLEIQQKIADILSTQDKLIELKQNLIDNKKQQKKWLMQNLLTGRIRLKGFSGKWEKVKLGKIADVKGGKRIPKGYQLQKENNSFPYITISDMENGNINTSNIRYVPFDVTDKIKKYRIYFDDIYISVAGTLGLIGTIPKELNGANLTENADRICNYHCNKQYLISILSSEIIQNQIKFLQTNNAQPKLAIEQIKNFIFNLPPIEEQTAIAEILSAQDKEIELLEKQLNQEKLKKKSLMQLLLTVK